MYHLTNFFSINFPEVNFIEQPYHGLVSSTTLTVNFEYLQNFKNKLIVINFSSENWRNFDEVIYKQLDQANINFLLLTFDYTKHQKYPRMFYFPYWYFYSTQAFIRPNINNNKKYYIGCLNANPKPHRIVNFLMLKKKSFYPNISISFHNHYDTTFFHDDGMGLTENENTEWQELRKSLPLYHTLAPPDDIDMTVPQLSQSHIHLITESTVLPEVFLTEKTWKPIACAVPFISWSNPGSMMLLKNLGVDIYDDVIDHKYYDSEQDGRTRLNRIHNLIDDLVRTGTDQIYNQLLNRCIKNQDRFYSGDFGISSYVSQVDDAIKKYS